GNRLPRWAAPDRGIRRPSRRPGNRTPDPACPSATALSRAAPHARRRRFARRRAPRLRAMRRESRRSELVDGVAERLGDLVDRLGRQAQALVIERLLVATLYRVEQRLAPDLLVQQQEPVQQAFRAPWAARHAVQKSIDQSELARDELTAQSTRFSNLASR